MAIQVFRTVPSYGSCDSFDREERDSHVGKISINKVQKEVTTLSDLYAAASSAKMNLKYLSRVFGALEKFSNDALFSEKGVRHLAMLVHWDMLIILSKAKQEKIEVPEAFKEVVEAIQTSVAKRFKSPDEYNRKEICISWRTH